MFVLQKDYVAFNGKLITHSSLGEEYTFTCGAYVKSDVQAQFYYTGNKPRQKQSKFT